MLSQRNTQKPLILFIITNRALFNTFGKSGVFVIWSIVSGFNSFLFTFGTLLYFPSITPFAACWTYYALALLNILIISNGTVRNTVAVGCIVIISRRTSLGSDAFMGWCFTSLTFRGTSLAKKICVSINELPWWTRGGADGFSNDFVVFWSVGMSLTGQALFEGSSKACSTAINTLYTFITCRITTIRVKSIFTFLYTPIIFKINIKSRHNFARSTIFTLFITLFTSLITFQTE